jgi:hypothetical protein
MTRHPRLLQQNQPLGDPSHGRTFRHDQAPAASHPFCLALVAVASETEASRARSWWQPSFKGRSAGTLPGGQRASLMQVPQRLTRRQLPPRRERLNVKGVFLVLEVKDQPMIRAIVLTVVAVFCIALTKRRRPTRRDPFDKLEMSADNLKAAVKKVDNSAAAVEVALKGLMAA